MDFSDALRSLKRGKMLCRAGWNGKFLRVFLVPNQDIQLKEGHPMTQRLPVGSMLGESQHMVILRRDGTVIPWLISQEDALADDWMIDDGGAEESFRGSAA